MNERDFVLVRLEPEFTIARFDCGDDDLNGFLANDAAVYQKERLAITHVLTSSLSTEIAGYFCLLTDKVAFDPSDEEQRKAWKIFNRQNKIHFNKHRKTYPSIKIGRMAVASIFFGQGLGRYMMNNIIGMALDMNNIACRFITVDAYESAFDFYQKNDFRFLSSKDNGEQTRLMYLDLKRFTI